MRVLVMGGGGLLGSHLVPKLTDAGHVVAVCDNMTGCPKITTGVRVFTSNVTDYNSTRQAFVSFKPEVIIFAVAHHYTRGVVYNFFDDTRLILDSANVLSSLVTREVKHVYFCSSSEVYGGPQTNRPLKETRKIISSATHHGTAKLSAEALLSFRCKELGVGFTALRIFDMFGPRNVFCSRTGIVSSLIDSFNRGEMVGLAGADRLRDFIHVEDVVGIISLLLLTDFNGTINVGTGEGTTLIQLVKYLASAMEIPEAPLLVPDRNIPTLSAVADTSLLLDILPSWSPTASIKTSISSLVEFSRRERRANTNNPLGVLNATRGL